MKTNPPPPANAGSDEAAPDELDRFLNDRTLEERMRGIRRRIVVLSGKGGVGKSTVAVNLAVSLALAGRKVGLLDVDIHGPSIPKLLRLEGARVEAANGEMQPIEHAGLKVMSIGFLLGGRDDAVIWRGPMKMHVIREFLQNVAWGDLDYLIVDSPPGTGDEPLSVCQLAAPLEGAVVVTTPQDLATADVRKSIVFCRKLSLPVLGVVENMSGFVCPSCGARSDIFKSGGGERMAAEMGVPFLGRIPIDPAVGAACDDGAPFIYHYSKSPTAQAFAAVCAPILALSEKPAPPSGGANPPPKGTAMKIAIPVADGKLCAHFGHCEQFALVETNAEGNAVAGTKMLTPPPHEPGVLPRWLHEQGATHIIAGGMGQRAQDLFARNGIQVIVGAPAGAPEELAAAFLAGTLQSGDNVCDH